MNKKYLCVSANRGGVIAVDGFSRRWFLKASAVTLAVLVQGRQRLAQGASRLLSSAATYAYGYEEGVAGQPVDTASPGVTATTGGPTYSAAAVKHGNLGVDVPALPKGGTLRYALPNSTAVTGSLYVKAVSRGARKTRIVEFMSGKTTLATVFLRPGGGLLLAGAAGVSSVQTTSRAAVGEWTRIDWQLTWDGSNLAVAVRYFAKDAESWTGYEQIDSSFASQLAPASVIVGSGSPTWHLELDTHRLYDTVDVWPEPFDPPPVVPTQELILGGHASATDFVVAGLVSGTTTVDLAVATSLDMSNPQYVGVLVPAADKVVRWNVTGLTPATTYYARTTTSDGYFGDVQTVKTLPDASPFTVKIILGSCQTNPKDSVTTKAWADANEWGFDLNVFVGDLGYYGQEMAETAPYTTHIKNYASHINRLSDMAATFHSGGSIWCISDHELCINGDKYTEGKNAANLTAFQNVMPVTLADTREPKRGRFYAFNIGSRVRAIVTDFRTLDRSPSTAPDDSNKHMFGDVQLNWLLGELSRPETLKVIISEGAWLADQPPPGKPHDKLWNYRTEQNVIADHIIDNNINVDFWGGDRHLIGYLSGVNNTLGGFPCVISSGTERNGLTLQPGELYDQVFGVDPLNDPNNPKKVVQYMRITLSDDGAGTISRAIEGVAWDVQADPANPVNWPRITPINATDTWNYTL